MFCGQENTARMKLKNKLRRRLLPISIKNKYGIIEKINIGDEITFNDIKILEKYLKKKNKILS